MKAIILAAGYATRLYPLTIDKPKPLLKINKREIINYIVDSISLLNCIDEIFVVVNNKFFENFLIWHKNFINNKKVKIINDKSNNENDKLGAIGDIDFVINHKKINDDILIIAGDSYFNFDLKVFLDFFIEKKHDCVCAQEILLQNDLKRFAVAQIDNNNLLLNLEEKPKNPKSNLAVYACYIYAKSTVKLIKKYLKENNCSDAPGYFLEWLYKIKKVYIHKIDKSFKFYDIGTIESYNKLNKKLEKHIY
ncbi:MAG: NTP transferase domain-containing protein [Clostridiales bacterium]|jgi:glucose-1-phosphate thymidylyltransferase|nr:NTP transferase domain-containing protein [Clostridiales bacterium]